ncbi:oligopeptide transport system substrate-binding protein [Ligilactobacillus sp. WC1T17]|uniref:Oligopeptide transport system substrate-binding protein n=1 Tax=Ligilactobacillus ruminis TaxID=1623 RepID=A0ABY1A9C3_9LACO|nr:oligopeptide transport system substrate-binding protein [Ligilactobacillus ruminis]
MKNLNKLMAASATLAIAGLALTGCGSKSSSSSVKQVLNWNEASELPTMDLSTATDTISFDMLNNSMEGLLRVGKDSKVEPGIAKSYKVSKDGLKYTFNLRKNAKWSNGDAVTAQDFVYSWRRTVDPKTGSQYAYLFDGIKNVDDVLAGKKPTSALGIKADGKYKLTVTLSKKLPYFKLLMGFPSFFPQNQKAVEKYGKKYGTAAKYMVYDGPFKMTGWTGSNLKWSLVKNTNYWDKKHVKLDKINFMVNKSTTTSYNLYQSKKLDQTILSTEQAKQLSNDSAYTVIKEARTNYLEFNQMKKEFQNKKIRQAISYAINRKELATKIMGAGTLPSKGIVSSGLAKRNGVDFADAAKTTAGVSYDKAKAAQLFKEGLKELGQSSLSFTLLGDDTDTAKKITAYLQSQLESNLPGLTVNVSNVPFKTRLSRSENGQFDVVASAWSADFSDPISFLDLFTSDNSYNNGKWSNAQYDKLVTASKTTDAGNRSARWNDMVKASKILSNEQGVVPLFQLNTPSLLRTNVKGVIHNTAGVSYNWKEAYLSK